MEGSKTVCQAPGDQTGKHIAGAGTRKPAWSIDRDVNSPVWRRNHGVRSFQDDHRSRFCGSGARAINLATGLFAKQRREFATMRRHDHRRRTSVQVQQFCVGQQAKRISVKDERMVRMQRLIELRARGRLTSKAGSDEQRPDAIIQSNCWPFPVHKCVGPVSFKIGRNHIARSAHGSARSKCGSASHLATNHRDKAAPVFVILRAGRWQYGTIKDMSGA